MSRILPASARNIAKSDAPASAVRAPRNPRSSAYATPATTLISPPNNAETAPCRPTQSPAIAAITAVAMSCHRRTVRIGLVLSGGVNRTRGAKSYAAPATSNHEIIAARTHPPQCACCAAMTRTGSAARQGPDDHQLGAGRQRRCEVARLGAVDEHLDVRTDLS